MAIACEEALSTSKDVLKSVLYEHEDASFSSVIDSIRLPEDFDRRDVERFVGYLILKDLVRDGWFEHVAEIRSAT